MLTTFNEVDLTEVMALRSRYKETFEKEHGVRLGFMSFFAKAAVEALKEISGSECIGRRHRCHSITTTTTSALLSRLSAD